VSTVTCGLLDRRRSDGHLSVAGGRLLRTPWYNTIIKPMDQLDDLVRIRGFRVFDKFKEGPLVGTRREVHILVGIVIEDQFTRFALHTFIRYRHDTAVFRRHRGFRGQVEQLPQFRNRLTFVDQMANRAEDRVEVRYREIDLAEPEVTAIPFDSKVTVQVLGYREFRDDPSGLFVRGILQLLGDILVTGEYVFDPVGLCHPCTIVSDSSYFPSACLLNQLDHFGLLGLKVLELLR